MGDVDPAPAFAARAGVRLAEHARMLHRPCIVAILAAGCGAATRPTAAAPASASAATPSTVAGDLRDDEEPAEIRTDTDSATVRTARVVLVDGGAAPRAALRLAPGDHDVAVQIAVETREVGRGARRSRPRSPARSRPPRHRCRPTACSRACGSTRRITRR
jgi:hypothetical protein